MDRPPAGNSCSLAWHAWSPGTDLHPTGASYSEAFGINDNGAVVGMADQQSVEPIIWESGIPRRLPDLGRGGVAVRINNNGYIIGFVYATNTWGGPTTNGAVWKPDGTLVNLGENSLPYDLDSQNRVAGTLAGTYGGWQPAIWDFGPMITVTATLTPNHVAPVEAHCFDAESQIAYRCFTSEVLPDSRTDVAQLQVAVVYNNGEPVRGAAVESTATVETGSGGHQHGDDQTRPVGTFYSTAENPNTATGSRRTIAGITAADGTAAFQYKSSGLSGFENLKVKVTLPNGVSAEAVARLSIEVPGLIELPRSATDYVVAGVKAEHPQNNFGTQALSEAAANCFHDYKAEMDRRDLPYFDRSTATQFVITEVGLPSGGMLDINGDWNAPHETHRFGRQFDLRRHNLDADRSDALQVSCLPFGLHLQPEGNHFHLSLGAP